VRGLREVSWPGRLERIVLDDGRELLLDAAHNPAGAAALASYLETAGTLRPVVLAVMRDKDIDGIVRALAPAVSAFVVTRASNPRSADPAALAAAARRLAPQRPVHVAANVSDAIDAGFRQSPRIVVAGSIFLLGDVIPTLRRS
jgi:dihydrofolate synthase/folylpolyglutamate synthase